ncbi:hypothetical protein NL676_013015 [Syzygium grande]|nr:hypothetical protein NL676_013015 [Syzygium grande]
MIALEDIYKVFAAMVPLYVALMLGYGSMKWWCMFTPEQCDGINRMFMAAHANLFEMNYSIIAADVISKFLAVLMLALCAKCSSKVDYSWCITTFSLLTLNNLLIVGTPVFRSMYGHVGVDLVVQLIVMQTILWFPLLLGFLEFWKMGMELSPTIANTDDSVQSEKDIKGTAEAVETNNTRPRLWTAVIIVVLKKALNPNIYTHVLGVTWAVIAQGFAIQEMPFVFASKVRLPPYIHLLT